MPEKTNVETDSTLLIFIKNYFLFNFKVMCIFPITVENKKAKLVFWKVLSSITLLISLIFLLIFLIKTEDFSNDSPVKAILFMTIILESVLLIITLINCSFIVPKCLQGMYNLTEIDKSLIKLGCQNEFEKVSKSLRFNKIYVPLTILFSCILSYFIHFILLNDVHFIKWVSLIFVFIYNRQFCLLTKDFFQLYHARFSSLNIKLQTLIGIDRGNEDVKVIKIFVQPKHNFNDRDIIKMIIKLYNRTFDICRSMSECLGLYNFFFILFNTIELTLQLYVITQIVLKESKHFTDYIKCCDSLIWAIFRIGNVIQFITSYVSVSTEANLTAAIVHHVLKSGKVSHVANDLELFSLQLLHRKLHFTVFGLYIIDFSLITSIAGTVATYLIILAQLIKPQDNT